MTGLLEGRVALVTGGGRGIGLAIAQLFAKEGASVVVNALSGASVSQAVEAIHAAGGRAIGAQGDISRSEDVQRVLAATVDKFEGLDILVNNAGVGYSATQKFGIGMRDVVACEEEDWRRVIDINLTGAFLFCKHGIPILLKGGGGVILNISSIGALRGARNAHAYMASKAGLHSLTRSMAVTYGASGLRVNAICPGPIDTDMIQDFLLPTAEARSALSAAAPLGRIGLPADIANLALFLASDAASYITGQILVADGGMTA